jgi:magnesium transporter
MVRRPHVNSIKRILDMKSDLNRLRKITAPLRDELHRMRADAPRLIQKNNQVFYRDIIDHLGVLYANFETFREMLRDLTELHNSNQNLVLGNTMKTLTVISAIFIPLTFIVGVYGMNVDFPEANSPYAYYKIWGFMVLVAGSLIFYMKRKRWF